MTMIPIPAETAPDPRPGEMWIQGGMLTLRVNDMVLVGDERYRVVRKTHGYAYLVPEIVKPADPADAYHMPDRTMEGRG